MCPLIHNTSLLQRACSVVSPRFPDRARCPHQLVVPLSFHRPAPRETRSKCPSLAGRTPSTPSPPRSLPLRISPEDEQRRGALQTTGPQYNPTLNYTAIINHLDQSLQSLQIIVAEKVYSRLPSFASQPHPVSAAPGIDYCPVLTRFESERGRQPSGAHHTVLVMSRPQNLLRCPLVVIRGLRSAIDLCVRRPNQASGV